MEDVDDEQEHLEHEDKQHRPCDLERAALKPKGEPLQAEHDDPECIVHPGPHNPVDTIERIVQGEANE